MSVFIITSTLLKYEYNLGCKFSVLSGALSAFTASLIILHITLSHDQGSDFIAFAYFYDINGDIF